jgi:hypothetical protein
MIPFPSKFRDLSSGYLHTRTSSPFMRSAALLSFAWMLSATANTAPAVQLTSERKSRLVRRNSGFADAATAGGVAAACATVTFHPLDTVKTVLQRGGTVAMLRAQGVRGLYRGVLPATFSMMPACAVRMSSYETLKSKLLQNAPASVPAGALVFLASALSVVVSSAVRAPLDLIKVQMQSGAVSSAGGALSAAWGSGGIRGVGRLYKGASLGLMRDVPFFGINLLVYEQLRAAALVRAQARVLSDGGRAELSTMDLIIIGAH